MSSCRLDKNRRLTKPTEFTAVYRGNQKRVKGQYFTVLAFSRTYALAKRDAGDTIPHAFCLARVGVVVSKKVSKSAVRRNRIKRLIRENFRCRLAHEGFDFIVLAKADADAAANMRLNKELDNLWKKLHRQCADYLSP